jgi:hypothetical protein
VTGSGEKIERKLDSPHKATVSNYRAHLEFFPAYDQAIAPVTLSNLRSLTEFDDNSIRYFAGKIKYTIDFDAPEGLDLNRKLFLLNPGRMSATAEVCLNGEFLSHMWLSDDEIPFSGLKAKGNRLVITVATSARNRFLGDLIEYGEFKTIATTSKDILKKEMPLMPSGLMGPLTITEM